MTSRRQQFTHLMRTALIVAALAATAVPASAQGSSPPVSKSQTSLQDSGFSDTDPCITATVAGQGHMQTQFIDRSTATTTDTTFKVHQNGQGTSTRDTAQYQYQYASEFSFRSSSSNFSFTTTLRKHIIRQGPLPSPIPSWMPYGKDDYFAQENVTFSSNSPSPSINSFTNESTCK
jgi:hypothetical protein